MNRLILFLCTPRCGTQWLAAVLGDVYRDCAAVHHEPIKFEYHPRRNLGNFSGPFLGDATAVEEHIDQLAETLADRSYIEIGWQTIAGIGVLSRAFPGRVQLVHLVRHPVNVAASLVTHGWYTKPGTKRSEEAELTPFDEGASLTYYRERWMELSDFEKCLYYWSEVNTRALEIESRFWETPYLRMKFEDIFLAGKSTARGTLQELTAFCGLPHRERAVDQLSHPVDEHRSTTYRRIDTSEISTHPQALALSLRWRYRPDQPINMRRYCSPGPFRRRLERACTRLGRIARAGFLAR